MFETKQKQLFTVPAKTKKASSKETSPSLTVMPIFVQKAMKKSVAAVSGNGAVKLSSTLDSFVDQFGKVGSYRQPRSFAQIEKDCELLWAESPLTATKFSIYLRMITRKVNFFDGTSTSEPQKGAELKHESIMRMIWLSQKSPETFWENFELFVSAGSWHDVFTMLNYDLVYNGWENRKLDWNKFGLHILNALNNKKTVDLVKKYLPQIKARSACKTVESQANCVIAKWICSLLFGNKESSLNYKTYRKLKTSGTAHEWQQLISQSKFDKIEFDKIHGRALNLLVRSKFLKNHNLSDKYAAWIGDPKTEVKYTGFVNELFAKLPRSLSGLEKNSQDTINKQFDSLVEKAKSANKENSTKFIVARDISSSMQSNAIGLTMSSFDVAKAIALYFSSFLTGKFANSYMTFESNVKMHTWKGATALEKWYNDKTAPLGATNFIGTIDLFVSLKKQGVDESEFPTGIICISDGDFNAVHASKTNEEMARLKLTNAGFSKSFVDNFVIVLWNIPNGYYSRQEAQFETTADQKGMYYFSGYSASVISFITGHEVKSARQIFDDAMNQELLNLVSVK